MKSLPLVVGFSGLLLAHPGFAQDENQDPTAPTAATDSAAPADNSSNAVSPSTDGETVADPQGSGDNAALLEEIRQLRQQVTDLETLKARLETLETQVAGQTKAAAAAPKPAANPVKISGYIQSRFENNQQRDPHTDFLLRRARIKLQADVTKNASAVIQWDGAGGSVSPLDAYVDLKSNTGGWYARFGQFRLPFGYEAFYESSNVRLAPERSRVVTTLFPFSVRDRGIFVARELKGKPSFYLGAVNGNGINGRDNNNDKDYIAHVEVPIGASTSFGVSGYSGKFTTIGANNARTDTDRDRWGVNLQTLLGPVELHTEYIAGKHAGQTVDGGYIQAALPTVRIPGGTPFVKYDWYDPSNGAASDYFSRWTLGYAYELDKSTRLTLAHEDAKDNATTGKDDITTFQVQVKF